MGLLQECLPVTVFSFGPLYAGSARPQLALASSTSGIPDGKCPAQRPSVSIDVYFSTNITNLPVLINAKIQGDGSTTHRCSHGGHGRWLENFRVRAGLDQEIREEPTRLDWF